MVFCCSIETLSKTHMKVTAEIMEMRKFPGREQRRTGALLIEDRKRG